MLTFITALPLFAQSPPIAVLRRRNQLHAFVLKKVRRCKLYIPSANADNENADPQSTSEESVATPDEIRALLTSKTKRDEQRGLLLVKRMPPDVALELLVLSIRTTENDFIRSTATISIGDIDMSDPSIRLSAVSLLSELLATAEDYSVRSAAGAAMGYISNVDKSVATSLAEALSRALLEDTEWQVHFSCLASLGHLGLSSAIPVLIKYLSHENSLLVQAAIGALGDLAAKDSVPNLLELLGSEDMMTRQRLARALSQMPNGASEPAIIDALRTLSNDQSIAVREASVEALRAFGFADAAKPETRSGEELIKKEVANLLEGNESGGADESASDALRRRLERSFHKEYADFRRLSKSGPGTDNSTHLSSLSSNVPTSIGNEESDKGTNRAKKDERTVQESSKDDKVEQFKTEGYDDLMNDLRNGDVSRKVLAAIELRKYDPKLALEAVVSTDSLNVDISPERLRAVCVSLLSRAGAIEKILEILKADPEQNVRSVCCDGLLDFPGDERAIEACINAFENDRHWLVRISAAITLGTIAKNNAKAEEALIASLSPDGVKDLASPQDLVIQRHAITALGFLGSRRALEIFAKMLDQDDSNVAAKYRIAAALSGILCTQSVVLARRLACDSSNDVSRMAQGALDTLAQNGFS